MKIYIPHASSFDYKAELYEPIRNSALNFAHDFIFPHETEEWKNTKDTIKGADLIVSEISFPSTGLGIELAWANSFNKHIIGIHRVDEPISPSTLSVITDVREYRSDAMIDVLAKIIQDFKK